MAKHRPSDAEIVDLLNIPHFNRPDAPAPSTDPITPTPMVIAVEQIACYDRNPRRCENSEYERIRESVLTAGMDQALTVTRRPGDPHYMIAAGGNTRLRIVQELWRDTQDPRFAQVQCLFKPWENEGATLIAHLKENDLRGDLTLIDRALAVRELREMIESENGERLSLRGLSDALKTHGYSISPSHLTRFDYTVDTLHPAIPVALQAGLGRPPVERLRALDRAFSDVWTTLDLGNGDMARSVFTDVLSRHDGPLIDFDGLRRALETELSVTSDLDVQRVSLMIGAALNGRPLTVAVPDDDREPSAPSTPPPLPQSTTPATPPARQVTTGDTFGSRPVAPVATSPVVPPPSPPTAGRVSPPAGAFGGTDDTLDPDESEDDAHQDTSAAEDTRPADLKSLRARAWTLACRFAQRTRPQLRQNHIQSIPTGMGYIVLPYDVDENSPVGDPDGVGQIGSAWWAVASLSQQFAPGNRTAAFLPTDYPNTVYHDGHEAVSTGEVRCITQFREHYLASDRGILDWFPHTDGGDLGQAWVRWPDEAWGDWVALADTCRLIYRATHGHPWDA